MINNNQLVWNQHAFHISFSLILNSSYQFASFKLFQFGFRKAHLRKPEKGEIAKYQKSSSKHVLPVLGF